MTTTNINTGVNSLLQGWIKEIKLNRSVFIDSRLVAAFYAAAAAAGVVGLNGGAFYPENNAVCVYLG